MKACAKLLSVLLVIALCFSLMAVTAYAEGDDSVTAGEENQEETVETTNDAPEEKSPEDGGEDETVVVNPVAEIDRGEDGVVKFASLSEALAAAESGETVTVIAELPVQSKTLTVSQTVELDLGGQTLTFANDSAAIEAAILVTGDAKLTIGNGDLVVKGGVKTVDEEEVSYGFAVAIYNESSRSVNLSELSIDQRNPSGKLFAVEGEGGVVIYGGAFSQDPSAWVAEDYEVAEELNEDGMYVVVEKAQEEAPMMMLMSIPADATKISVGEDKYNEIDVALQNMTDEATVKLNEDVTGDVNAADIPSGVSEFTLDLGGKTLTGNVTVPAGVYVEITNGTIDGDLTVNGYCDLTGTLSVGSVTVAATDAGEAALGVNSANVKTGPITVNGSNAKNVTAIYISSGSFGAVSASGDNILGGIEGGTFAAQVPAELVVVGYEPTTAAPFTVKKITATVKSADEKTAYDASDLSNTNAVTHYKGEKQASLNSDFSFKASSEIEYVSAAAGFSSSSELEAAKITNGITIKKDGTVTISKDAPFLEELPAGRCVLGFKFKNGGYVEVPVNVYAAVTYTPSKYYKSSANPIVFTPTDLPDELSLRKVSDNKKAGEGTAIAASNYTVADGKITLKTDYLESLESGAYYVDFKFPMQTASSGSLTTKYYYAQCKITVAVNYKVTKINDVAVSTDTSVEWHTNSGKSISFVIAGSSKDFTGVQIDGTTIDKSYFTYADSTANNVAYTTVELKASYLNKLSIANHGVTFLFKDGEATATVKVLKGSASPKTGDENNAALWAGVLILSGAAAVALLPKKKKQ